jgi:hypothetical protein
VNKGARKCARDVEILKRDERRRIALRDKKGP